MSAFNHFIDDDVVAHKTSGYRFGAASPIEFAERLRRFAAKIEDGDILIHTIEEGQTVSPDDYTMQSIKFQYCQRIKASEQGPEEEVDE